MDVGSSRAQVIPKAAQGLHVLLVDNDTSCLTHIASVLEEQSYQVTTTKHASIALSLIRVRERLYDLVIAELNMPEMNGFTFIKQVLLIKEDIPIILISSTDDMNIAKKALYEGACFYLSKPIRSHDLANVWQHAFRKRCKRRNYSNVVENQDAPIVPIEKPCDVSHDIEQRVDSENLKGKGKAPCLDEGNEGKMRKNKDEEKVAKNKGVIIQENRGKRGRLKNDGKRRHKEKGKAKKYDENVDTRKRQRFMWSTELHDRFVQAIARLGEDKAQPKPLMRELDVPGLSRRHIASHLQKYRIQSRKMKKYLPQNHPPFQSKRIQEPTTLPLSMMNTKLELPRFQSMMMPKPTHHFFSSHTPSAGYTQPQTSYESMMMSKPKQHFFSSYTLSAKYEQPKTIFESLKMSKPAQNLYSIHTPSAGYPQPQIALNAGNAYYNLDTLKKILGPNKLPKTSNDQNVQESLGNQEFPKSNHTQNATPGQKGKQLVSSFEGYEANTNDAAADNLGISNIDALLESWKNELANVLGSDPILHQDMSALASYNVVPKKSQEPSTVVHTACKELEASKEIPVACEGSAPSKEISKACEKLAPDNTEFNMGQKHFYQDLAKIWEDLNDGN